MKKPLFVIFLGPPGAGKDTQAEIIKKNYRFAMIRSGDMIRHKIKADSQLATQLAAGELVDDVLVNDLVASFINTLPDDASIVSDGFPRRLTQAQWLDQYLAETGRSIDHVIELQVAETVIYDRLKIRGRTDDHAQTVKRRLNLYKKETQAVLDYYRRRNIVQIINGSASIEEVADKIKQSLDL